MSECIWSDLEVVDKLDNNLDDASPAVTTADAVTSMAAVTTADAKTTLHAVTQLHG